MTSLKDSWSGRARTFDQGKGNLLLYWPHRPRAVTRALSELAESNPTPAEYAQRKRAILEAHRD
jgi:hypothetical protein